MGLWLRHRIQSSVILVEAATQAKTEKSTPSSVEGEGFANSFLRLQGDGALVFTTGLGQ